MLARHPHIPSGGPAAAESTSRRAGRWATPRANRLAARWARLLVCVVAVLAALHPLAAQTLPVQATVVLAQPSTYPEDLADPGALVVSLLLLDASPRAGAGLPVRLELSLSDQTGRTLRVADPAALPVVDLRPGVPTVLTGAELRPFLEELIVADRANREALVAGGLRPRATVLSEGQLTVCARVYLAGRLDLPPISLPGCGMGFAELHDPPSLLRPTYEVASNPAAIVNFSWVPNHAGGVVDYELTVYELPAGFPRQRPGDSPAGERG